jgi:hypothetical protein
MTDLFLERDAVISDCGSYRYLLRRTWDHDKPRCLFIMLNPSTADAEIDDATIRSCIRLSKGFGYGSFEVINLFGLRATDPAELAKAEDPIGPMNERIGAAAIIRCDVAICAWGAHPMAQRHGQNIVGLVRSYRPAAYCLGKTKAGAPKHPLYIKSGTALETYGA